MLSNKAQFRSPQETLIRPQAKILHLMVFLNFKMGLP